MSLNKDSIRRALGLSEGASDDEIIARLAERRGLTGTTATAPETMRWSMPIDPSAVQPSSITLAEAKTELTGLFTQITEVNPNGLSVAEKDQIEQSFAKYPQLYDAYRKASLQQDG
jgi:hypothetical protein